MKPRVPWVTLAVVAGAFFVMAAPALEPYLIYDCERIVAGEVWRMFSGHWVHFSPRHLILDAGALGLVGWMMHARIFTGFGKLCLVGPWAISAGLVLFEPQMRWYGGLSGLAVAAAVYAGVQGLRDEGIWRWIWSGLLLLVAAKLGFELMVRTSDFVSLAEAGVRVSFKSHIGGAIVGAFFGLCSRLAMVPPCVAVGDRAKQVGAESPDYSR